MEEHSTVQICEYTEEEKVRPAVPFILSLPILLSVLFWGQCDVITIYWVSMHYSPGFWPHCGSHAEIYNMISAHKRLVIELES